MKAHSVYYRYTVVGLSVHGLSRPEEVFAGLGAVWAERTCTSIVANGRNSTGYLVAHPEPFKLVEYLRKGDWLVGEPRVMYHGTLADYFTNPRAEEDGERRAKTAEQRCDEWRTSYDHFYLEV